MMVVAPALRVKPGLEAAGRRIGYLEGTLSPPCCFRETSRGSTGKAIARFSEQERGERCLIGTSASFTWAVAPALP